MQNIYTISTVDTPEYKRIVCGRTNDVTALLNHISQGHSVALFGERRIGKTSVLFLIRDIINGEVDNYQSLMIDLAFRNAIPTLKAKVTSCRAMYLSVQGSDPKSFASFLCNKVSVYLPKKGTPVKNKSAPESGLVTFFQKLNDNLPKQKLIILLDEIDGLLDSSECKQIFRSLRDIVQSCPNICFVFAGAEMWHKVIKDKTSPLVNNVFSFYLKATETYPVEEYLIKSQLTPHLGTINNTSKVAQTILEWTGSKAWYVQAVCYEIVEICGPEKHLPDKWGEIIEANVIKSVGPTLKAFYEGDNLDEITRKILALLANKPGLNVKEIASGLGFSEKAIWDKIVDLDALDKIRKHGSDYYIVGSLAEKYGKKTQEVPRTISKWPQRLRWVTAITLVFLAIWLYWYTHPPLQIIPVIYPAGIVYIRMPSTIEQDETGTTVISAHNITANDVYSITLSLASTDIDYQLDGSNRIVFESLRANEIRYWEPNFSARDPISGTVYSSNINIIQNTNQFSATYQFDISQRTIPIKKYWAILSLLLVSISGFITKKDLMVLASELIAGVSKLQNKTEQKDDEKA